MISRLATLMYHEHSIILDATKTVLAQEKVWEKNPEDYESSLNGLLNFFSFYADKYHHYKEEEIIFRALLKTNESSVTAIVNELLEHHEDFRGSLGKIRMELSEKKYLSCYQKMSVYLNELQDHIAAEDEELFPMMDSLFSEEELENLYFRCVDIDDELGVEHKKELENYIKNLNIQVDEATR